MISYFYTLLQTFFIPSYFLILRADRRLHLYYLFLAVLIVCGMGPSFAIVIKIIVGGGSPLWYWFRLFPVVAVLPLLCVEFFRIVGALGMIRKLDLWFNFHRFSGLVYFFLELLLPLAGKLFHLFACLFLLLVNFVDKIITKLSSFWYLVHMVSHGLWVCRYPLRLLSLPHSMFFRYFLPVTISLL